MLLQVKMLIGFVAGLAAGLMAHMLAPGAPWVEWVTTYLTQPFGQIFLRLLFMLVIPLLFSALVIGIAEMGDVRALRRIGLKTLFWTVTVSSIAVAIAIAAVNLLRPGAGVDPLLARQLLGEAGGNASAIIAGSREAPTGLDAILAIIPSNVVTAASQNDILAVMFFALMFGIGLLLVRTPAADRLQEAIQGMFDVTMRLIGLLIRLAPYAVACFMFNLAAIFGWELLVRLGAFVGVVLLALAIQMFVVYPLLLSLFASTAPLRFFRGIQEAMVMAFSTASSNATLPTSLRVAEQKLHLPTRVSRFVLTIGATANQNGTAMFEGVTVLFLAPFFGVELSLTQQLTVVLVCILGGIGTAGVPAGSLPVIALILGMVGIPPEGIGLVLGVDRFLDMCRTTLNVTGDLAIAATVARGEKEDDRPPSAAAAPVV